MSKLICAILVLAMLLLSACTAPVAPAVTPPVPYPPSSEPTVLTAYPTPTTAPKEPAPSAARLILEEYQLLDDFPMDGQPFVAAVGSQAEILARHAALRVDAPPQPDPLLWQGQALEAREDMRDNEMVVTVTLGGKNILTIPCGTPSPVNNLRGLWVVDGHWYVEVAHVSENRADPDPNRVVLETRGEIFRDGISLNATRGYEQSFGFQSMAGEPFHFFVKDGVFGYSNANQETSLNFTDILHYRCCSAGSLNPRAYPNLVSFFAARGDQKFYVEAGVFEP